MYSEDAYCLGLLYAHIYANKKMVLKDDLDKFHKIIESNLRSMNKDIYATVWYDNDPSIYFASEGKNGEIYYVLYPNFDLDRAKSKYIGCLSTDVLVASQKENALNSIDLKKENGRIVKKKINELRIPTYDFLKDVEVCEIKHSEDHIQLQEAANRRIEEGRRREAKAWHDAKDFITGSTNLSITNVDDETTKDCRSCQNMSCRVESCEKPVDNCIGYIHHDEKQEQPKNMVLTKKKKVGIKMKIISRLNIKNDSINQSQDSREAISKQDEIEKELYEVRVFNEDDRKNNKSCKLEQHKALLYIDDVSEKYSNDMENNAYYECICLECGKHKDYKMSLSDRMHIIKTNLSPMETFMSFYEVRKRYLELIKQNCTVEEIIDNLNSFYKKNQEQGPVLTKKKN